MGSLKEVRWRQRFDNFTKSYKLLEKYAAMELSSEFEKAGLIQFFEINFELAWEVMKDYLEAHGYIVKSPRETIKQAYQMGLIDDGHVWLQALANRNLTTHAYDEVFTEKFVKDIQQLDFGNLKHYMKNS